MIVKLLSEHHLELLSLKGGCRGSSESSLVKMSNCWKSHALAHFCICQKAQISSVSAYMIENFPALIEKSPKIINLKLEIVFMKRYAPNH